MTENQVTVAMEKYGKQISDINLSLLKKNLSLADESCMDELMILPIKNKWITLLLSLFFGGIGAGRFYLGDVKMGILHIAVAVLTVALSFVPILGIIVGIANSVWVIAEIFICFYKVKYNNYEALSNFLAKHKREGIADEKKTDK